MMVIVFRSLKEIFKNGSCSPFQGPLSLFSLSCYGNLSLTLLTPLDRHQTCNSLEVDEDRLSFPYHTILVLRGCQQAICHELYPYTEPETLKQTIMCSATRLFFFFLLLSPNYSEISFIHKNRLSIFTDTAASRRLLLNYCV